jgi:hypothetical protein
MYVLYSEMTSHSSVCVVVPWEVAKFVVFDRPDLPFSPLDARVDTLFQLKAQLGDNSMVVIDFEKCRDEEHLFQYFSAKIHQNASGIFLRDPKSFYTQLKAVCADPVTYYVKVSLLCG